VKPKPVAAVLKVSSTSAEEIEFTTCQDVGVAMKEIELTQGQVALVDDIDYEFLMQWKWHAAWNRNGFRARRSLPKKNGKWRKLRMHTAVGERMGIDITHTLITKIETLSTTVGRIFEGQQIVRINTIVVPRRIILPVSRVFTLKVVNIGPSSSCMVNNTILAVSTPSLKPQPSCRKRDENL
jgi:hypothetical protein